MEACQDSCSEINSSLDSNYHNRTSPVNTSTCQFSHFDTDSSTHNFYSNSRNQTEASVTDSSVEEEAITCNLLPKNTSFGDVSYSRVTCRRENVLDNSIPYDDNILLSRNTPLYDSLEVVDTIRNREAEKPRTIRGSTLYNSSNEKYYGSRKPNSLPNLNEHQPAVVYDSESTLEQDFGQTTATFKPNTNIRLVHRDKVTENIIYDDSEFSNVENNPIYDEIFNSSHVLQLSEDCLSESTLRNSNLNTVSSSSRLDETVNDTACDKEPIKNNCTKTNDNPIRKRFEILNEDRESGAKDSNKHTHSYLRDFLESQKGSKKPLQNFLSKKISRAFSEKPSKIVDNNRISSPSNQKLKNAHIEENVKVNPHKEDSGDRFIVNIGKHFDLTTDTKAPLDFEVNVCKSSKQKLNAADNKDYEETFLSTVENLKHILKDLGDNRKPEIVGVKTKSGKEEFLNRNSRATFEKLSQDSNMEKQNIKKLIEEEFQEKLGTVRNYWDRVINEATNEATSKDNGEENHKCKIVDIKTKVGDVKRLFEEEASGKTKEKQENLVQITKKIFEPSGAQTRTCDEKLTKRCSNVYENPHFQRDNQFESLNPNIVEIISHPEKFQSGAEGGADQCAEKGAQCAGNDGTHNEQVITSKGVANQPDFDHVRYRIMKSDVFQKRIFANYEKESQFDGLVQYLQDYSFQELLIDNNIVIIEPIRSNVRHEPRKTRTARNFTQIIQRTPKQRGDVKPITRRHFFYHPIRVNKEVIDDELPNPDRVRQVRQFFETGMKKSQSVKDLKNERLEYQHDPDKDLCSLADTNSSNETNFSGATSSDYGSNEDLFESLNDLGYESQYISEEVLQKIREHGTTVTYYGGRILDVYNGKTRSLTNVIMDEIQKNQKTLKNMTKRSEYLKEVSLKNDVDQNRNRRDETFPGIKFRLLKSNSCSSRLELIGAKNLSNYRNRFLQKQKHLLDEHNRRKQNDGNLQSENEAKESYENCSTDDHHNIDLNEENIERADENGPSGNDKTDATENEEAIEKSYTEITFSKQKSRTPYDYKIEQQTKQQHDMEFEQYEVAGC